MKKTAQLNQTSLYNDAELRMKELMAAKEFMQKFISTAPEGKIHIIRKNQAIQYYVRKTPSDRSGNYLPKTESSKIRKYLQKAYYEKAITIVESEIDTLKKILSCSRFSQNMIEIYSEYPEEIRNFVVPLECSDEDFVNKWMEEKYVGKQIPETTATFTTNKGEQVRSKSELNIANALAAKGIPYKYECPLTLKGGNTIYPDFTVLNVKKRRVIYWEHRGMMDDRGYSRDAVERTKDMNRNGIILGKNLIITEETGNCPLNTTEIDAVINNYFL